MEINQGHVRLIVGPKANALVLMVFVGCLASGCVTSKDTHYDLAAGPNDIRYHDGLQGMRFPSIEAINQASTGNWRFNQSMDEVWKACLEIASQYQAIISITKNAQGRTICVIKGRDAQMSPSDEMTETTFGSYYDQWLAIAVFEDSGRTGMSVAIIDPLSGQARTSASVEQALFAQVQIQLNSTASWGEKFADVDWQKRPPRFQNNNTQASKVMPPAGFEVALGDWIAKRLRLELGVVSCPEVNQSLNLVAQKLKEAARIPSAGSVVHILGSPGINAFALPNGEIYVTSGLLDSAQSIDEVAAVLAHEIDHLKNGDVASKLRLQAQGTAGANTLRFAWGVAQIAMSAVPGGGLGAVIGEDIGTAIVQHGVQSTAEHLQVGMVEDFSANIELRADEHGCETLYLAGFNPEANLSFLAGLKEKQGNTLSKKTVAMSDFVNMQPGLDERIEKMKKTLARLKTDATKAK